MDRPYIPKAIAGRKGPPSSPPFPVPKSHTPTERPCPISADETDAAVSGLGTAMLIAGGTVLFWIGVICGVLVS